MASGPKTIEVEPGGELDRLLGEAPRTPLRLVRGGKSFRVKIEEDTDDGWVGDDPDPARDRAPALSGRLANAGHGLTESGPPIPSGTDPRPSPEQVARSITGIRKSAGAWAGNVDAEAFKA